MSLNILPNKKVCIYWLHFLSWKPDLICSLSVQHEDSSSSGSTARLELGYLVEERVRVLSRLDELKARLTELEQQLQESKQEVVFTGGYRTPSV